MAERIEPIGPAYRATAREITGHPSDPPPRSPQAPAEHSPHIDPPEPTRPAGALRHPGWTGRAGMEDQQRSADELIKYRHQSRLAERGSDARGYASTEADPQNSQQNADLKKERDDLSGRSSDHTGNGSERNADLRNERDELPNRSSADARSQDSERNADLKQERQAELTDARREAREQVLGRETRDAAHEMKSDHSSSKSLDGYDPGRAVERSRGE